MRSFRNALLSPRVYFRFLILVAVLSALAAVTPLSNASAPALTINVVNNSGWEIRHLYLSPANNDDWGLDQLTTYIGPGTTRTLDVSWDQSTVKLVAEDQDGCFMKTTVDATGSQVWTITGDTARDCGD